MNALCVEDDLDPVAARGMVSAIASIPSVTQHQPRTGGGGGMQGQLQ